MTDEPRPPRKRPRLRLSLRALMLIVLISGGLIGWKANRARDQRQAVEAVRAVNGSVVYDFQLKSWEGPGVGMNSNTEPSAPKFLRNLLGDEYFQEVTMVAVMSPVGPEFLPRLAKFDHLVRLNLNASKLDESAMAEIAKLPALQSLVLTQATANDGWIARLASARKLRDLNFFGAAGVTDAGLAPLADLPDFKSLGIYTAPRLTFHGLKKLGPRLAELESLILYLTDISDEGMDCLDACRKLKKISLSNAKFGDAGFAHFRNLASIEQLIVSGCGVTDEGLNAVRGLTTLRTLAIPQTKVTDRGLSALETLPALENLGLSLTKVTDEGLGSIRKIKSLKDLSLIGTAATPQAIAELLAERPTLRITSVMPTLMRPPPPPATPTPPAPAAK